MDNIKRNPEYRNYAVICAAIEFVENKLKPYTEKKLQDTHQQVYQKVAGMPACRQQCSVVFKNQIIQWCASCRSWKNHLMNTRNRQGNVQWENMHSDQWPYEYQQIVGVYLPNAWDTQNYQDLSTACNIWSNMKACKISPALLKRIRTVRNQYFAHNTSKSATNLEKSRAFDTFRDLFRDMDVTPYIDANECYHSLTLIENGVGEDRQLSNIERKLQIIQNVQEEQNNSYLLRHITKYLLHLIKVHWRALTLYLVILASIVFCIFRPIWKQKHQECISEQYNIPFQQDLPLFPYLGGHSSFIGREWLFKDLNNYILSKSQNANGNGIVLVAEMGYGKSAIISELLCPTFSQDRFQEIRQHVAAFHVCKFDVRATHDPGRFIRRLVGFLSMKSAEFGNIVSMLPDSSLLYDKEACRKEPEACFDQGVTFPMKQLKTIENPPWVIVIDALDECETSGHNEILKLLIRRTNDLPKWIKLVVTSRNMTSLTRLRQIKIEHLESNDQRNLNDLKTFINVHLPEYHLETNITDSLLAKGDGNFVYIVQAVSWLLTQNESTALPKLPADLDNVYQINFDRQFGATEQYAIPKVILEIVCSTLNPLDQSDIYSILKGNEVLYNESEFHHRFNKLSFFLNVENGVRVKHQAMFYWLTSEINLNYRISVEAGHGLISTYLFSIMKDKKSVDLVDLAIHVCNSRDLTLKKVFVSSPLVSEDIVYKDSMLHKLIWKTSAVTPLELMLEHIHQVDKVNEGNVTASFVAASNGNVDQLELLHKRGADISFQVYGNFIIYSGNISVKIEAMKRLYYSGYSLLHIAAQHGHLNVVRYLLHHNSTLLRRKNSLGLHAGHVACENGHIHVIKEMFGFDSKLFGYECLYYASKHNHIQVVKWLISHGVKFRCISDRMSDEALKEITVISDLFLHNWVFFPDTDNLLPNINPVDKWWIIYKFNPLLEAIRMGSLKIATLLIDAFPHALNCSDAFGFTTSLSSVVYNRSDIYPLMLDRITTDKCRKASPFIINSTQNDISKMSMENLCPEGGGVAHILALYGTDRKLLYFVKNQFQMIQWNTPDIGGNYPIHYAVTKRDLLFVYFVRIRLNVINDTRTSDGSTSYHISAKAGILSILFQLTDSLKLPVPDLKDKYQQGIIHHLVQMTFNDLLPGFDKEKQDISLYMFDILVNKFGHDLAALDAFDRNILHYALRYGHYKIIMRLINLNKINNLLHQRDSEGHHPVEYALKNYQRDTYFMVIKRGKCPYYLCFITACTKDYDELTEFMSPWEMGIFTVIQNMSYSELELLVEPLLSDIWLKSSYLITAVMQIHNYKNEHAIRQLVVKNEITGVTKYNQFMLVYFVPSVYNVCGKPLVDSPLHYIMLYFDFKDTLLSFSEVNQKFALDRLFPKTKGKLFLNCKDKHGFNIFHYALMGGNIGGARLFMDRGIQLLDNHISIKHILLMTLQAPLRSPDNFLFGCPLSVVSQEACTDFILRDILKSHKHKYVENDMCNNGSTNLSPIHLLAANGMIRSIKFLVKMFSSDILNCKSADGFTPLYLGKLFSKTDLITFIEKRTTLTMPLGDVELLLLLHLYDNFPKSGNTPTNNQFKCTTMVSPMSIRNKKWYHCMKSVLNHTYFNSDPPFLILKIVGTDLLNIVQHLEYCLIVSDIIISGRWNCIIDETMLTCDTIIAHIANNLTLLVKHYRDYASTITRVKRIIRLLEICNRNRQIDCSKNIQGCLIALDVYRALMYTLKSEVQNIVIQYYLQGKQALAINVDGYDFLLQRFEEYKINTSRHMQDPIITIDKYVILNFNHFQYLHIFRSMLSVSDLELRKSIRLGFFSNDERVVRKEIQAFEMKILTEPLKGLDPGIATNHVRHSFFNFVEKVP